MTRVKRVIVVLGGVALCATLSLLVIINQVGNTIRQSQQVTVCVHKFLGVNSSPNSTFIQYLVKEDFRPELISVWTFKSELRADEKALVQVNAASKLCGFEIIINQA